MERKIVISLDGFKEYMKKNESAFRAENEIINEKLAEGINGLEWLVLQVAIDEQKIKELDRYIEYCNEIEGKQFISILKDAMVMQHEEFYEKHELNWWIAVKDSLTYLALLKEKNYDDYFSLLQSIYQ